MGKPIGRKSYGSIEHLPDSRMGPADHSISPGQAKIATMQTRDRNDCVIVMEKLDGSNVSVANVDGVLYALTRSGNLAQQSRYEQHQWFATWVRERTDRFSFLMDGERVCGEWLAQAHGTRYALPHEPFVAFDLMRGEARAPFVEFINRISPRFVIPRLLSVGPACSIRRAMELQDPSTHGALDPIEGAIWRVERDGKFDFACKYVRPDKVDGCYLPFITNASPVFNWRPGTAETGD